MKYTLTIEDEEGGEVFEASAQTFALLEEKFGAYQRRNPGEIEVEPHVFIKGF